MDREVVSDFDAGLDIFDPPAEPDASRAKRERRPFVPKPDAVCVNADGDPRHAKRPCTYPGPRCASCGKAKSKEDKKRAKDRAVENLYGLTPDEYDELFEAQGGRCYVCRRANGRRKRLAVDHDHLLAFIHRHPPKHGCKKCCRGLACGWCNREVLGRLGGNPATYERIATELRDPPARRLWGK